MQRFAVRLRIAERRIICILPSTVAYYARRCITSDRSRFAVRPRALESLPGTIFKAPLRQRVATPCGRHAVRSARGMQHTAVLTRDTSPRRPGGPVPDGRL